MNLKQAMTYARRALGPNAAIRDDRKPSSPAQREADRLLYMERTWAKEAASAAADARRAELLAADAEYQRLDAEYRAARELLAKTSHGIYYRYTVGTLGSLFFSVKAQADTLDELIEKLTTKEKA